MRINNDDLRKKIQHQFAAVSEATGELKHRFVTMPRRTKVLSVTATVLCVASAALFLRYAGVARGRRIYAYFLLGKNVANALAQFSNKENKEIVSQYSSTSPATGSDDQTADVIEETVK